MTKDRTNSQKQALPGARRGPTTFYMDARELWIKGWDDDDRGHYLYNPSAHAPIDARLKRRIKATEGNAVPVKVVREGDRVLVKAGRDRVKAMRELAIEAEAAGEEVLLVHCTAERGREAQHFAEMVDENNARKTDNPITRAELSQRALKYMGEDEAADLIGIGVPMMKKLWKLLDLCQELQDAVASGQVTIIKALTVHGRPVSEQLALLNGSAPKPEPKPKRPALKKVSSVLAATENWLHASSAKSADYALSLLLLRWFSGAATDDELMKAAPHLAADIGPKPRKAAAPASEETPKRDTDKRKKAKAEELTW